MLCFRQLEQRKQFTSGSLYKPKVQDVQGELSLKDYEDITIKDKKIEDLQQLGLTPEEVELKLSSEQVRKVYILICVHIPSWQICHPDLKENFSSLEKNKFCLCPNTYLSKFTDISFYPTTTLFNASLLGMGMSKYGPKLLFSYVSQCQYIFRF